MSSAAEPARRSPKARLMKRATYAPLSSGLVWTSPLTYWNLFHP